MAFPDGSEIVVSLQRRSPDRRSSECHLALGVLITAEQAVFDLPADVEFGDAPQLDVLIAPVGAGERDVIERIRPLQVLVRSLRETPWARVALVPLAQPSRYGAARPRLDRDVVERALERTGEIWSALIELKLARRPLRDVHPAELLDRLDGIVARQLHSLVQIRLERTPGEIANCPFSNITECGSGGFFRADL
ncbi:hypothetical protein HCN51_21645 [Nonomuraea sp. FMUSA5-5]|uniref:Uncharacterized protein n=1 Tax=Nonomuraea composti TaxID=2720023 RepID=A0ABX1B2I3_9ACTN|nr:hypothetical protein [Nonomuraea sp. FMUSA5-5]NJP92033.1 hypothetical protein [Nonomuraea sp. FMUSA5-5]